MFRFTIRDVLWLTVVVAMGVGWWMDHARLESQSDEHERLKVENRYMREFIEERYEYIKRTERGWTFSEKTSPDEH